MAESLKDIISKIRKEKEAAAQAAQMAEQIKAGPKPKIPPEEEADFEETPEEFEEEPKKVKPETKQETAQASPELSQEEQIINEEVAILQNNGMFRRELLAALQKIGDNLENIAGLFK